MSDRVLENAWQLGLVIAVIWGLSAGYKNMQTPGDRILGPGWPGWLNAIATLWVLVVWIALLGLGVYAFGVFIWYVLNR